MKLRVLIVDDEVYACRRLERAIGLLPDEVEFLPVAHDGDTAVQRVAKDRPDIVFLDINLPGLSGIDVSRLILDTAVVFVTAHAAFAVEAFEVGAVDYLLKPVSGAALSRAISRCRQRIATKLPGPAATAPAPASRIRATFGHRTHYLHILDYDRFYGAGKYTAVLANDQEFLVEVSLSTLESSLHQLAPGQFMRTHRRELIRLAAVACIRTGASGCEAELFNGQRALVSRRCVARLRHALSRQAIG